MHFQFFFFLLFVSLLLVILPAFRSVCTALRAWLFSSASERVVARLRKNLFSHLILQVKLAFFNFLLSLYNIFFLFYYVNTKLLLSSIYYFVIGFCRK